MAMYDDNDEERLRQLVARFDDLSLDESREACRLLQQSILKKRGSGYVPTGVDIIRAHRDGVCLECGRDILDVADEAGWQEREASHMAENKAPRKVRVSRPRRVPAKSWLEKAHEVRERILAARGGVPLPSTAEAIREIREGERNWLAANPDMESYRFEILD